MSQAAATALRRYDSATAHLEPPFAVVDLAAMRATAAAMVRRAGPKPIRLASKPVRCRQLIETVLRMDGFRGVLAFTLPEALWLADCGISDGIGAYPDGGPGRAGAAGRQPGGRRGHHRDGRAKAGEFCERFNELQLIDGEAVVASAPTCRGEGRAFR